MAPRGSSFRVFRSGALLAVLVGFAVPADGPPPPAGGGAVAVARVRGMLANAPLSFIENRGQGDARVAYSVRGGDTTVDLRPDGITFTLSRRARSRSLETSAVRLAGLRSARRPAEPPDEQRWRLDVGFVGANPDVVPTGEEPTAALVSYFRGRPDRWRAGVRTYGRVVYHELWPGIDLAYTGDARRLKYTFVVKPGADPGRIRLAYRGATALAVADDGGLAVTTPVGVLREEAPHSYQELAGRRIRVTTAYAVGHGRAADKHVVGFGVGPYDRTRPLVIDPIVLVYAGYLGGPGADLGQGIAVDAAGHAYVTGITASAAGDDDVFVAKVRADGTGLVYAAYIGGSGSDWGFGIAVDGAGQAYVTGSTNSDAATFPVTVGPDLSFNGSSLFGQGDAFVAKLSADGAALVYCGYIGGSGDELGAGIAVDGLGQAYVAGWTTSTEASFPVLVGPALTASSSGDFPDAFVAKVRADGAGLVYAGYIGGAGDDAAYAIAIDAAGSAYVAGETTSDPTTFPVAGGPVLTYGGNGDAFVAKVRADGTGLVYAGYIGGAADSEAGRGIAVDGGGSAYVVGHTSSDETTFPVLVGPSLTFTDSLAAFVAKVRPDGSGFVYAGYIGGAVGAAGYAVAADDTGHAYVTGVTDSDETSFPVKHGPDLTHNGGRDAFVAKVRADGAGLVWAGYLGGSGDDSGQGIAVDPSGAVYVVGYTQSTEATFPGLAGPDLTFGGVTDAFVAKISEIPRAVAIDIKPGSFPNAINPRSRGRVPVAILSSADFDAPGTVDPASLTFGRTGDEPSLGFCNVTGQDVDGDGRPDLVCHFETRQTGFVAGDVQGILKGQTRDGLAIRGSDAVRIVPAG